MTHREWALQQRQQTDLVLAHFLMGRMSPQETVDYMQNMEDNPDTRYPPLERKEKNG